METWKAKDERKLQKSKMDQRRIGWNLQQERTKQYREMDKEVKNRYRQDRNKYIGLYRYWKERRRQRKRGETETLQLCSIM